MVLVLVGISIALLFIVGAARAKPARFELSPEELQRIKTLAQEEESTLQEDAAQESEEVDISDLPPELRMDHYDSEDEMEIMEHGDVAIVNDQDDDSEDAEDNDIKPTDSLIVVAMTEDDYSHLEVYLMTEEGNLYVHHDITLPDFPICLAWMDTPPYRLNDKQDTIGNYIAVGTFDPAIEIWNLDILDPLEPSAVLGGKTTSVSKKKKKETTTYLPGSHTEAVMGLSWNRVYRQALSSGSADKSVKIWDVTTQQCSHTFTHHTDKVQSVNFHPVEGWLLASGSFDKTVATIDCRSGAVTSTTAISSDIESLAWSPHHPHLYCSMEDGSVSCIDLRSTHTPGKKSKPLFTFKAHQATTSAISFNTLVEGMLATASIDKTVKIWDTAAASASNPPKLVAYKSMNVGKLFTMQYSLDSPFTLAAAGDKGDVAVWESDEQEVIQRHFEGRHRESSLAYTNLQSEMVESMHSMEIGDMATNEDEVAEQSDIVTTGDAKKKKKNKKNKNKA